MRVSRTLWAFVLLVSISPSAFSEDKPAPAAQPAKSEAVQPATTAAAVSTAAPAEQPKTLPQAEPKSDCPACKCACPECPGEKGGEQSLAGCSKALRFISTGLKEALDGFQKWSAEVSSQVEALEKKEADLRGNLKDNAAATEKLRSESEKANKKRIKELKKEAGAIAKDLKAAGKEKAKLCSSISKAAAQKVKDISADLKERLSQTQEQIKL